MKKRLKIATIAACPFPYPRGTPTRIFRMAEALTERGHEVHVITYHLGQDVAAVPFQVYRIPEVKTYQKYSPGPTYQKLLLLDLLLAIKLLQVLRKHQIDVIYAHHYEGLLVAAAVQKVTNHPIIYDAHTLLQSELPFYGLGLSKKIKGLIGNFLDYQLPKLADHTISVTKEIEKKLIQEAKLDSEKITTVTMGVEYDHFDRTSNHDTLDRNDKKTLIFTGNLAAYQGIEFMLQAFRQVLNQHPNVRLRVVSNSSFDGYEALTKRLGIREFIDLTPSNFHDLSHHFAETDIALNPRVNCDGIPLKLLNYMAAGKAIVSFAGSAKVIEHNKTGLVVEDGDTAAFAQAICQLVENPRLAKELGVNAKKQVKAEHTWDIIARRTEVVCEAVSALRQPNQLRLTEYRPTQILYRWTREILNYLFVNKSPKRSKAEI